MSKVVRRCFQHNRVLWGIYRDAFDIVFRGQSLSLARQLSGSSDENVRKLSEAIRLLAIGRSHQDNEWIERIEALRVLMLNNDAPLVDGTLGNPGIYDRKDTIKSACNVSKPPRAAFFLYALVRAFKSSKILELGTNVGISAAYLAAGGAQNTNRPEVVTLDSSIYRQRVAKQLHQQLNLYGIQYVQGLFSETLLAVLDVGRCPDLAFIDGHHQYQPTLDYLNQVAAHATDGCLFVFDDIDWSDGMRRAWNEIRSDLRFGVVLDLKTVGVCILGKADESRRVVVGPIRIF